jgi:tRNA pseudouridine38-40 synthase
MARLKLYFSYDGTYYSGLQRQANTSNTIQEILETKLSMISNTRVSLMASGRTDAGVHARIQVAHCNIPDNVAARPNLMKSLNSLLPPDIRMLLIETVHEGFDALRDVQKKTYVYFIDPNPIQWPELRNYAWHLRLPLNWPAMEEATKDLLGDHDFKALCAADTTARSTVRTVYEARWGTVDWRGVGGCYELRALRVTGSGFLKNMVRSIAGTLVHIGNGKASSDLIRRCLESRERSMAGPSAPAHGLWLWDILYS